MVAVSLKKNFFKQKTAYEITTRLVGSEMCIRDREEAGHKAEAGGMDGGTHKSDVKVTTREVMEHK